LKHAVKLPAEETKIVVGGAHPLDTDDGRFKLPPDNEKEQGQLAEYTAPQAPCDQPWSPTHGSV